MWAAEPPIQREQTHEISIDVGDVMDGHVVDNSDDTLPEQV